MREVIAVSQRLVLQPAPSPRGVVFDIRQYAIHDGPGIRTTVFFKGCPLTCAWCHNPESQSIHPELIYRRSRCMACLACLPACPEAAIRLETIPGGISLLTTDRQRCEACGACAAVCHAEARQMVGQEMTVEQVMARLEQDIPFYDESGGGVTFSGGEPLLQGDFLLALLKACRQREIHTAVDTSGFAAWPVIASICPYTDLFLYDLKLMDDAKHRQYTGVSNTLILSNLRRLSAAGQGLLIRIPIIPGINDDEDNLRRSGEFLLSLPRLHAVQLLPYHASASSKYRGLDKAYSLSEMSAPSPQRMQEIARFLQTYGLAVTV